MAKLKYREIKIQMNNKFNTNGTVHDTIEGAFEYWDRKLPNQNVTFLIFPKDGALWHEVLREIQEGCDEYLDYENYYDYTKKKKWMKAKKLITKYWESF